MDTTFIAKSNLLLYLIRCKFTLNLNKFIFFKYPMNIYSAVLFYQVLLFSLIWANIDSNTCVDRSYMIHGSQLRASVGSIYIICDPEYSWLTVHYNLHSWLLCNKPANYITYYNDLTLSWVAFIHSTLLITTSYVCVSFTN